MFLEPALAAARHGIVLVDAPPPRAPASTICPLSLFPHPAGMNGFGRRLPSTPCYPSSTAMRRKAQTGRMPKMTKIRSSIEITVTRLTRENRRKVKDIGN
jgi:hypothetical protein